MRPLLIALLIAWPSISTLPQGTVNFSNATSVLSSPPDRLVRFDSTAAAFNPFGTNYAPAVSNLAPGLRAQLYYGTLTMAEEDLIAVAYPPASFRASTSANAGAWFGGTRTLAPFGGNTFDVGTEASLQARIWDISLASTYEA